MVNLVAAQKPLLHALLKLGGLRPQTVEVEPGTTISFWAPNAKKLHKPNKPLTRVLGSPTVLTNGRNKKKKPAVVLLHGFAAEGIITWQFQIPALTKKYEVYVPDLLFFGGSFTGSDDRSPAFQARCMVTALEKLGVEDCTVVAFSYGGMVAFKMAETRPDLVKNLVISGSVIAMTDSISSETLERLGYSSSAQLLMPESVKGLKDLLSLSAYKRLWFPDFLYKDYLKVMFSNRKERVELLEGLVISNKDAKVPALQQRILLLWGEDDNMFNIQLANNMKEIGDHTYKIGYASQVGQHGYYAANACMIGNWGRMLYCMVYKKAATLFTLRGLPSTTDVSRNFLPYMVNTPDAEE